MLEAQKILRIFCCTPSVGLYILNVWFVIGETTRATKGVQYLFWANTYILDWRATIVPLLGQHLYL